MHITFRADASSDQGAGHIMRCLALADELAKRGHFCTFLTQPFLPQVLDKIKKHGHNVIALKTKQVPDSDLCKVSEYLSWLSRSVQQDAYETKTVLGSLNTSIMIVDHYALDSAWMSALGCLTCIKVVIDDLANRSHLCDILIDQNYGRSPKDYANLVNDDVNLLIGPEYAMLHSSFREARTESLTTRQNRVPKRINICMGGMDKDNATLDVLKILTGVNEISNWVIDIALTASAPHLKSIEKFVSNWGSKMKLHVDSPDMAKLMMNADLAIGASGTTLWERCCLGLPTLNVTIADNQIPAARAISMSGACKYVGDIRNATWKENLQVELVKLVSNAHRINEMSLIASQICDGTGLQNVCDVLESTQIDK